MTKPTVVVVNGTADEGYWAVYYLLQTGLFNVRTTARRLSGERVARLQALDIEGNRCEVVQAASNDRAALVEAFAGAQGIYGTSIYNIYASRYRPANPEEIAQCRAVIEAAQMSAELEHFIWQTMTRFEIDPKELGIDPPIHFRTKWQFEEVIREAGLPWTFLRQPAYMRQIKFGMQYKDRLVYPYAPDARLAYVAEQDLGKFVAAIFASRDKHMHQSVNGVSEVVTPIELAKRIHEFRPRFRPDYRQATWLENAVFDQIIVRLKPAYRYPSQINANIKAGNYFAMTLDDKAYCEALISPLKLETLEGWLTEYLANSA